MSMKRLCDYCGKEIKDGKNKPKVTVIVFDSNGDKELLEKDVCTDCANIVLRLLLMKGIDRLKLALEAASDW